MIKRCERCGRETHFLERCNYCGKFVCRSCIHASKNVDKTKRYVICKACWTDTKKMKAWENA